MPALTDRFLLGMQILAGRNDLLVRQTNLGTGLLELLDVGLSGHGGASSLGPSLLIQ
jgi:hypothetical protein